MTESIGIDTDIPVDLGTTLGTQKDEDNRHPEPEKQSQEAVNKDSKDEIMDIPFTREKCPKPFQKEINERRDKILDLIRKIGFYNLDDKLLAKQFEVSDRTIRRDISWIKGHYKPEELRNIKILFDLAAKRAFNESFLLTTNSDLDIRLKAIDSLIKAMKAYNEKLENWGEKPITPINQNLNITGGTIDVNTVIKAATAAGFRTAGNGIPMEGEESKNTN